MRLSNVSLVLFIECCLKRLIEPKNKVYELVVKIQVLFLKNDPKMSNLIYRVYHLVRGKLTFHSKIN